MTMLAESALATRAAHQPREGGSIPTSAIQLHVHRVMAPAAFSLNERWHRTLPILRTGFVQSARVCYAASFDDRPFAVAIWRNPTARLLPQREWLELTRFAISPDAPRNTASRVLSVMARLIRRDLPDVVRLISYQDTSQHTGAIYRAAGWSQVSTASPSNTDWIGRSPGRPRPMLNGKTGPKVRWEKSLL